MKQFQKLVFQPGINREGTNYSAEGFWWDCDRVRFRKGLPETIGGWVKYATASFAGACRSLLSWVTLDGSVMLGMGTSKKLYIENGGGFNDITPIRTVFTETNPITTGVPLSNIVTFATSTPHGASMGDYVTVANATAVDGVVAASLNVEFAILDTPSLTTFTVDTGDACILGGVNGGGAGVTLTFQIPVGAESSAVGAGWGVGPYGRGAWSSASVTPFSSAFNMRIWSLANYGEDLIAAPFGKSPYYWTASTGLALRAVLLSTLPGATGVPAAVGFIAVTGERHVVAFGVTDLGTGNYDPMLIRWASQEAPADWTPTVTNTSGDFRLTAGSDIEGFSIMRDGILVITDTALYAMTYTGPPFVFDIKQIANNVSCVGPNSIITLDTVTYWMGQHKFYMYNGVSQSIPCSVHREVFENFNHAQDRQVCAGHIEHFSEIWWFYCSADSDVLDKYVVFNYVDNLWFIGNLGRTAWTRTVDTHELIAAGEDGFLYVQEFGATDGSTTPASSLGAFIESSDFDIQDGTAHYFVERIVPDIRFDRSSAPTPEVNFTLKARDFPGQSYATTQSSAVVQTATVPVDQYTHETWVRVRGRHVAIRVEADSSDVGTAWQLGFPRLSVRTDGRR